jgi:hydroxyacylglutathione hydrolase
MLEDDFTYVLRKAFKGLALAPGEAALRAGLAESAVLGLSRGNFSPDVARGLAPVLGLDPAALADHPNYHPRPQSVRGIHRLELPFGEDGVNAWRITAGATAILFDTGDDSVSCRRALQDLNLSPPNQVFITHGHGDHIGGISAFLEMGLPVYGPSIAGISDLTAGTTIDCGPSILRTWDLSGHFTPSLGYQVDGLEVPVFVTGDALFAGSMGGCNSPERYQHALDRLHAVLDPLPGETVILPGHGPATTLGEERRGNPFFAARRG